MGEKNDLKDESALIILILFKPINQINKNPLNRSCRGTNLRK